MGWASRRLTQCILSAVLGFSAAGWAQLAFSSCPTSPSSKISGELQAHWEQALSNGDPNNNASPEVRVLVLFELADEPESTVVDRQVGPPVQRPPLPTRIKEITDGLGRAFPGKLGQKRAFTAVPAMSAVVDCTTAGDMAGRDDVRLIDLDRRLQLGLDVSVPLLGMDVLHALERPVGGVKGAGAKVAVIDSGLATAHPDFEDAVAAEACFCAGCCPDGGNEQFGDGAAAETTGHGTQVTGALLSRGVVAPVGPAPAAQVVAVRVADDDGAIYLSDLMAALEWLAEDHPDLAVVNISLGTEVGLTFLDLACDGTAPWLDALGDAVQLVVDNDTLVVASAGNNGNDDSISAPACLSNVISVGATWKQDYSGPSGFCNDSDPRQDQRACFSNISEDLDLMAPGAKILTSSLDEGGNFVAAEVSGTSFSAPIVAGCVAQLRGALPALSAQRIRDALLVSPTQVEVEVSDSNNGSQLTTLSFPRLDCQRAFEHLDGLFTDRFELLP